MDTPRISRFLQHVLGSLSHHQTFDLFTILFSSASIPYIG